MNPKTEISSDIRDFLSQKRFVVDKITPNKRFVMIEGWVPEHNYKILLKIELNNSSSLSHRNQVTWTKSVQDTVPQDAHYRIAPILDHGIIGKSKYWILMPLVVGTPFAIMQGTVSHTDLDKPEQYFDDIIDLMKHIEKTPTQSLEGIDLRHKHISRNDKLALLENVIRWLSPNTPYPGELLQIISNNYTGLRPTPSHGDFTETNLIIDGIKRPVLIDAELGSNQRYKYYDVAEFYNRLYTRLCQPELAQQFLHRYISTIHPSRRTGFLNNFLCLSALRCAGNFYEIEGMKGTDGERRHKYALQFAEAIVTYRIIQT